MHDWQKSLMETLTPQNSCARKIIWRWETVGAAGKTMFCKHLIIIWPKRVFYFRGTVKTNDVFNGLLTFKKEEGQWPDVVLIDLPRGGGVDYTTLEQIKDGLGYCGKYEGGMVTMNPPHLVVFANTPPIREKLSADRWDVQNIGEVVPVLGRKRPFSAVSEPLE